MLIDALRRAPDHSGPAVRDALARTRDFRGATGQITFGARRRVVKPAVILRVEGGGYQLVRTATP